MLSLCPAGRGNRRVGKGHREVGRLGEMDCVGFIVLEEGPARAASKALDAQRAGQERPERKPVPLPRVHAQQRPQLQGRPEGESRTG